MNITNEFINYINTTIKGSIEKCVFEARSGEGVDEITYPADGEIHSIGIVNNKIVISCFVHCEEGTQLKSVKIYGKKGGADNASVLFFEHEISLGVSNLTEALVDIELSLFQFKLEEGSLNKYEKVV